MSKKIEQLSTNNKNQNTITSSNMKKQTYISKSDNNLPKKRGRRPKKIINDETDDFSEQDEKQNFPGSSIIVQMKIDTTKLTNNKKKTPIENDNFSEELSDGMFNNDIPNDITCRKCIKNEKKIALLKSTLEKYDSVEHISNTNKIHKNNINVLSSITGEKMLNNKEVWCVWDGHPFTNKAFHLPETYHKGIYYVVGHFCSPNCALAHNLYYIKDVNVHQRRSLVFQMYREMMGISVDEKIVLLEAPCREALIRFGGDMSIEQFRHSFSILNKEYIVYFPPMKPTLPIIEERVIGVHNSEDKKYALRRKTPIKKKNSVLLSMKKAGNK